MKPALVPLRTSPLACERAVFWGGTARGWSSSGKGSGKMEVGAGVTRDQCGPAAHAWEQTSQEGFPVLSPSGHSGLPPSPSCSDPVHRLWSGAVHRLSLCTCLQSGAWGCSEPAGKVLEQNLKVHPCLAVCPVCHRSGRLEGMLCSRGAGAWASGLRRRFRPAAEAPWSYAVPCLIQSCSPVSRCRSSEHPCPLPAEHPHVPLHRQHLRRGEAQALHRLPRGQLPRAIVRDCGEPVHESGRFSWRGAVRTSHGAL